MTKRDYTFGITDVARLQIDNFTFSTGADGKLYLTLIETSDPEILVRGPRTTQPWEKRGEVRFGVAIGSYSLSGDDKSSPCTVGVKAEPAFVVIEGTVVYFVGTPGSLVKLVFAIEDLHTVSGYED
jgi:hypothetical protein